MEFTRATKMRNKVNLTTLIDVIFLLIVFFLLTSEFARLNVINLDVASIKTDQEKGKEITAVILKDGSNFIFEDKEIDLKSLLPLLLDKPNITLYVRKGIKLQNLIKILDDMKDHGIRNISVLEGNDAL